MLWKNVWVVSLYTHFKGLYFLLLLKKGITGWGFKFHYKTCPRLQHMALLFFQLSLSFAWLFNKLSLKCCLSVPYHTEILSYQDRLHFPYLSVCLRLGPYISYLCNLFAIIIFISLQLIVQPHWYRQTCFLDIFVKSLASWCCLAFA